MSESCPTCYGRGFLPDVKLCALPGCGRTFRWQEDGRGRGRPRVDAIYCSRSCQNVANQRAHRQRAAQKEAEAKSPGPRLTSEQIASLDPVVYYMRLGDIIKIGTTVDLVRRAVQLLPDEILATEPGGRDLESQRHRMFRHLRVRGERFRAGPDLLEHIQRVREAHSQPAVPVPDDVPF